MRNRKSVIFLLVLLLLNFSCVSLAKPGEIIYLIPENFTGGVIVVFNQPDGITPETDKDGTIIYRVPQDGLIKVREPFNRTVSEYRYFFVDEQGKRTPIEYLYPENYVRNPGDTTSRNFDQVTEDEANNKIFSTQHRTENFFAGKERIYIQSFIVEKPIKALKTFIDTNHRGFDIQREFMKGAKIITGKPQDENE